MKIEWNGFLQEVVKPERALGESCAWIFTEKPFSPKDVWHVCEVKNVGLKGRKVADTFAPDPKEFSALKRQARRDHVTRIGNVHTHVILGYPDLTDGEGALIEAKVKWDRPVIDQMIAQQSRPSGTDLSYAKRFNDVIRGIIVVLFPEKDQSGEIVAIIWHDQFGQTLAQGAII